MAAGGRPPLLEKTFGRPGVLLVGARLRRFDVLDVFAHVFLLGPDSQDLTQRFELLFLLSGLAVEIGESAQRLDVVG
jgi:hypothetical protein